MFTFDVANITFFFENTHKFSTQKQIFEKKLKTATYFFLFLYRVMQINVRGLLHGEENNYKEIKNKNQ